MPGESKPTDDWMKRVTCPSQEIVLFSRQLQVMLSVGVQLHVALEVLSAHSNHPQFVRAVSTLTQKVTNGYRFSQALHLFPRLFNHAFCSIVAVGEETGQLERCLHSLSLWKERDMGMLRRIKSAMTYPVLVLGLTLSMTLVMFTSILPSFTGIFTDMGAELPMPTEILILFTHIVVNPGFWLVMIVLGVATFQALKRLWQVPASQARIVMRIMQIPTLGDIIHGLAITRFSASMATMLESGVGLSKALTLASQASGNPAIVLDSERVAAEIRDGSLVSKALSERSDLYPNHLIQMLKVGEEASDLSVMFGRAAKFYEEETNYSTEALGAALEPILLSIVAAILGFVLVAIFLPLYSHLDKL